ncbi:hypothetical protein Cgig2_018137 [Carnegiea gigantea]|uniref:Uncharacterized protein n=1 Tax=Carnegiea gigantea TaxID=171969 RepID=A0A9Q1KZ13_9CARY|nr:hypothetical protein Cgig2_018137 [Carnegiea gigantea]
MGQRIRSSVCHYGAIRVALKQVQEAVIIEKIKATERQLEPIRGFEYEPTPGYATSYQQARGQHPQRDVNALLGGDARRIIEAKQAMRKAQNSVAPSHSVTTPYVFKGQGAEGYEQQEECSRLRFSEAGGSEETILLLLKPVGRTLTRTRVPRSTHPSSERQVPRRE